uniref:Ribosomal protein L27a n=1 Tax=Trepomonas sp. PC1 TaxID=1076344 RepID=A0A146KBL1_9EUKA|eukprot:JAP92861.1 Ribosomal protein L27a [Trepomonas sp. PC1]
MPTRLRKHQKCHGDRQHGYGRIGKHRKHFGGKGKAGGEHQRRIMFNKYHPGHFGKLGMRNYHRRDEEMRMININKIWTLIPEEQREKFLATKDANNCPVVDVTQFGYFGVIARGYMPEAPIIVKARYFSQIAEEKIKGAKGACVLVK